MASSIEQEALSCLSLRWPEIRLIQAIEARGLDQRVIICTVDKSINQSINQSVNQSNDADPLPEKLVLRIAPTINQSTEIRRFRRQALSQPVLYATVIKSINQIVEPQSINQYLPHILHVHAQDRSINQSIDQSISHSTNQSISQSIDQSPRDWCCEAFIEQYNLGESTAQQFLQKIQSSRSFTHSLTQSVNQSINQSVSSASESSMTLSREDPLTGVFNDMARVLASLHCFKPINQSNDRYYSYIQSARFVDSDPSINQSVNQSINQSTNQSINSANQQLELVGELTNWASFFDDFLPSVKRCQQANLLSINQSIKLQQIYEQSKQLIQSTDQNDKFRRFVHADVNANNIRVSLDPINQSIKFAGLIDYGDCLIGDPLYDLGRFMSHRLGVFFANKLSQSVNQSAPQCIFESINQIEQTYWNHRHENATTQSINQSTNQSVDQPISQRKQSFFDDTDRILLAFYATHYALWLIDTLVQFNQSINRPIDQSEIQKYLDTIDVLIYSAIWNSSVQ